MGFQAAQIVHAAGETSPGDLPPNTNAIVLSVENETELLRMAKMLQLNGVRHLLVREIDPPFTNQCTAIGVVPLAERVKVKKFLSELPLLGREKSHGQNEGSDAGVKIGGT